MLSFLLIYFRTCREREGEGPLLRAKFHPHRCNVSPLWGEKPQNRPLSKLNNRRFALRAVLPVNDLFHQLGRKTLTQSIVTSVCQLFIITLGTSVFFFFEKFSRVCLFVCTLKGKLLELSAPICRHMVGPIQQDGRDFEQSGC